MPLPPLTAAIFALIGDLSEDVASLTEKRELHGSVSRDTLHFPPRSETPVPIRSDQISLDGPVAYSRGVRWADSDFPGFCSLVGHNADGVLVLQQRVPVECKDDDTLETAWKWLDRHFPEQCVASAPRSVESRSYPSLRLI